VLSGNTSSNDREGKSPSRVKFEELCSTSVGPRRVKLCNVCLPPKSCFLLLCVRRKMHCNCSIRHLGSFPSPCGLRRYPCRILANAPGTIHVKHCSHFPITYANCIVFLACFLSSLAKRHHHFHAMREYKTGMTPISRKGVASMLHTEMCMVHTVTFMSIETNTPLYEIGNQTECGISCR
jgi:hypothetical protein